MSKAHRALGELYALEPAEAGFTARLFHMPERNGDATPWLVTINRETRFVAALFAHTAAEGWSLATELAHLIERGTDGRTEPTTPANRA